MTTNRAPKSRRRTSKALAPFTPEVLAAFRRMEAATCTCKPTDWEGKYWEHEQCAGCEEWWAAHDILHSGVSLPPHRFPAFHDPAALNPYPEGSNAAARWDAERERDTDGAELYRQLKAAT
jgi:hypothetical protein